MIAYLFLILLHVRIYFCSIYYHVAAPKPICGRPLNSTAFTTLEDCAFFAVENNAIAFNVIANTNCVIFTDIYGTCTCTSTVQSFLLVNGINPDVACPSNQTVWNSLQGYLSAGSQTSCSTSGVWGAWTNVTGCTNATSYYNGANHVLACGYGVRQRSRTCTTAPGTPCW